eukprot:SAG11_NODE_25787_length_354_cov_0.607843_1_plen_91_part_10
MFLASAKKSSQTSKSALCPGDTALTIATFNGNLEAVQVRTAMRTPEFMHCAPIGSRWYISKVLLDYGADVNCTNTDGYSPLLLAARRADMV